MKVLWFVALLLTLAVPVFAQEVDTRPMFSLDRVSCAAAVRYCGFSSGSEGAGINVPLVDKEFIAGIPVAYTLTKHVKLTGSAFWGLDSHVIRWEAGLNFQLLGEKR